jgi:tyrosinase
LGPNTPDVNKGEPIDKYASGDLDLSALKQGNYLPALPLEGFNMALDKHLHGNVHGDTGDDHNMGAVPWAARDPIFWLHHGNIDRLWASWNQAGGLNPSGSWLDQQFTFADENGTRVLAKVVDFKDIGPLQYRYDRLESPPPVFKAFTGAASDINRTSAVAYTLKTPVNLGPRPVRAALQPVAAAAGKAFSTNAVTLVESRRVYLVIKRIETDIPPRVPFNLYLNAPEGSAAPPQVHLAGRVSFFGVAHQGHDAAAADTPNDFVSFDVTEVIRGLIARNLLSETPTVTIAPVGRPAGNAKPVIGEISIVQL